MQIKSLLGLGLIGFGTQNVSGIVPGKSETRPNIIWISTEDFSMKLIQILQISHIKDYILELTIDDGCIKRLDFSELITFKGITEPIKNIDYFKSVKIIFNGRAFGWDNDYDCCADWVRYFAKDLQNEWIDFDDNTNLNQRMKITQKRSFFSSIQLSS